MIIKDIEDIDFLQEVIEKIKLLGYELKVNDKELIDYITNTEVERLNHKCNTDIIDTELKYTLLNSIVSEFYSLKLLTNSLDNFDFEIAVKSLTEGDTSYTFDSNMNSEDKFRLLLEKMKAGSDYLCFRKMNW